jgi:lysophospholipase L1-like esterase
MTHTFIRLVSRFRAVVWMACALAVCPAAPAQYDGDIGRWIAQDTLQPHAPGAILFTGSSSIRRWERLAEDFADYRVIQRGFGGSQFEDLTRYADDLVLRHRPGAVVVWEGTNDIASGETGDEVFADYQQFVKRVRAELPDVPIFYVGIMPTPGRFHLEAENAVANRRIQAFAAEHDGLYYIDIPSAFHALDPPEDDGFTALFVDAIHLGQAGYDIWTRVIRPQVEAVVPPNKVYAPDDQTLRPGRSILLDLGSSNPEDGEPTPATDADGRHWNNWHPAEGGEPVNAGEHLGRLTDTAGETTCVGITITGGFRTRGKAHGGLMAPDPELLGDLAVPTATQDYFFCSADGKLGGGNDDDPGGLMIHGLDPARRYDLTLLGSREHTQTRITEYRVRGAVGRTVTLQTSGTGIGADGAFDGNDDQPVVITGVRPDAFGQVFIDLTLIAGEHAYLNALKLTAQRDGESGTGDAP